MKLLLCLVGITAVCGIPTPYRNSDEKLDSCGYKACPQIEPNSLNVHIVPHSHDDVGWLKTVDQYYFGSRTYYQRAGVQYIIDSVVTALQQNPERRFIQVETAFFHQWWERQGEDRRQQFKQLVDNGQLEIIGGGWSMNDEAAVHYQSVIDQFTLGLRIINDTLGECGRSKIGWQIDPFGHSREMASIFSQMGYDALFFARLDWRDKNARLSSQTAEILWKGSDSLGDESNLFTSVLYNHYSAPSGYCFDVLCSDDPIIDDQSSPEYNYQIKVEGFAAFIRQQAKNYKTNNIIITMGDDFNYQDALSYYTNLDKLIAGFKLFEQSYNDKPINVFYSTPSCYVKAVNEEATQRSLPFYVKSDDFFPYASDYHAYWSGYYTSRPTSKRFERQGNNLLQITKQLTSFVHQDQDRISQLISLQEAMGIMQHHDAITGTERQHVADDYHRIMDAAFEQCAHQINDILSVLLPKEATEDISVNLDNCLLANVSICALSQSDNFIAAVYNPLSRPVTHYVRLPVNSQTYTIKGPNDESVAYQILPSIDNFNHLSEYYPAPYELVFKTELAPLGLKLYKVETDQTDKFFGVTVDTSEGRFKLGNEEAGFEIDDVTGLLNSITIANVTLAVKQELMYYIGARGNNQGFENRASGAYIFRPSPTSPTAYSFTRNVNTTIYKGALVEEVHQEFSSWAKQIIRVYKGSDHIEFDWLIGPINIDDDEGREIISRFTTNLDTDDIFYTDSNGRETLKRKRNFRATFNYTDEEPVAGNYYPITSRIILKDDVKNIEFAVLNDRSQGGSSLKSGELELMMHRRLLDDDAFGVSEPLNEQQFGQGLVARGQHYVTLGMSHNSDTKSSAASQRDIAQRKLLAPWTFLSKSTELWDNVNHEIAGITRALPDNVQILTLEPWRASDSTILLRLEHVLETGDDVNLSQDAVVNLQDLFTRFDVKSLQEMTLAGNQFLEDNSRLEWIIGDQLENVSRNSTTSRNQQHIKKVQNPKDFSITLSAMQIRTFLLKITYK